MAIFVRCKNIVILLRCKNMQQNNINIRRGFYSDNFKKTYCLYQPVQAPHLLFDNQQRRGRQKPTPSLLVPKAGLEPARYRYHRILSPARLPISPLRRFISIFAEIICIFNRFCATIIINRVFISFRLLYNSTLFLFSQAYLGGLWKN